MGQTIESQVNERVHISHRGSVSIYQAVKTFMGESWLAMLSYSKLHIA